MEGKDTAVEFKVGGFVALKADAVAKVDMTPVRLLKAGWPNKFLILEIYEDEKAGKLLRLDPCCGWMMDLIKEEEHACEAHPAKYFEPAAGHIADQAEEGDGTVDANGKGRRYSGFGRGESAEDAVGVEYVEGGEKPASFFFRRAGTSPVVLRGEAADKAMALLAKLGIL
jgi:hypothetical protein